MSDKPREGILEKISSGIEGFDDITSGGLPRGRTTLLMGGPGCGKTVFALQVLVGAATHHGTPGIFVAFEENARRVSANAETFGWNMCQLEKKQLFFIDACLRSDVVKSGAFDLTGLLAALEAVAREMGAKLIVFDAIDVLLSLLDDPAAECRELYRLHEWLVRNELTGIFTTKVEENKPATAQRYGFMPFMADCAVLLSQRVVDRVTVRAVRVLKYRGSPHVLNEVPFVIGPEGVEVGSSNGVHPEPQPFKERVSTGIERLDDMIGGGFYRGTNALLTGSSGGGKSTLAGAFIAAACRRGERTLFISFDENSRDIVRDLATMSIDLAPHLASGLLRMEAVRSEAASSEDHFMRMKRVIAEQLPRCVAIDPLSALARVGGGLAARAVAERLIYLCRNAGITVLFTSLLEGIDPHLETTTLHVSTIADSWIQISYALLDGERNRALSIVKSRGSKHSTITRTDLQRPRYYARRPIHGRVQGADGHLAHGKGERQVNAGDRLNGAYVFRLYIAGGAPNSVRALANLYAICRRHFPESHRIEVIDVLQEPLRALTEAILVTPTVVKVSPAPEQQIIGNLSEEEEVLRALGLPQKENG